MGRQKQSLSILPKITPSISSSDYCHNLTQNLQSVNFLHIIAKFASKYCQIFVGLFLDFFEIICTVIQPRKMTMSFFLVSTQMMPINDLMVEEDRNQFVPLIGRAQSEGSIDSSVTAKLITP